MGATEEFDMSVAAYRETPSFQNELFTSSKLWYQYRGFKGFWSILENDSFRATDARFSNDSEEQRFGTKIMRRLLSGDGSGVDSEFNEDYIVCFCAEDDKLSQWRGYAPDGGASIGFDFNAAAPFYIPLADKQLDYDMRKDDYQSRFVYAGRVCYLPPNSGELNSDAYYQKCADIISYPFNLDKRDHGVNEQILKRCAPFIKHAGFREENELRLVFRNEDGKLSPCVHYREIDKNGARCPYIIVRPGNPAFVEQSCVARLCLRPGSDKSDELLSLLPSVPGLLKVENCCQMEDGGDLDDDFCFGCTRRRQMNDYSVDKPCRYKIPHNGAFEWGVQNDEHSVIISQGKKQEEVFKEIYPLVKKVDPSISVWCEGHLPIRSITVGPCIRQKEVTESIVHYCRHVYWLRDVVVKASHIPFRRPM